jgi:electron transport complex protein RnfB
MKNPPIDRLDAVLPQTQCGECGFKGCLPYAEAMQTGKAEINKCPPGGLSTLQQLAQLLGRDSTVFEREVSANTREPMRAYIREQDCIGCTKCLDACPVDAIIGSGKLMHTVIADECTGCRLCIPACPVDCIESITLPELQFDKSLAKARFEARNERQGNAPAVAPSLSKLDYIQAALARANQKQNRP